MLYKAFLSYSHAADDKLAFALQSALHQFARPWYKLRAVRIFRDKTSLSASPALWPSIENALRESEYLLLLASPDAARSQWVEREVAWWLQNRSAETMLVLLTDGELLWDSLSGDFDWSRTTVLPGSVKGRIREEPLHVDLRWGKTAENLSLRHSQFRRAVLDVAAPLHGRAKDELDGEDVRQYRRFKTGVGVACVLLLALAILSAVAAYKASKNADIAEARRIESDEQRALAVGQRKLAEERRRQAEEAREAEKSQRLEADRQRNLAVARQVAADAELLRNERLETSALLAVESARRSPGFESDRVLRKTLDLLPMPISVLRHGRGVDVVAFSSDGRLAFTGSEDGQSRLFETASGKQLKSFHSDGAVTVAAFSRDGRYLVMAGKDGNAEVLEAATWQKISRWSRRGAVYALAFSQDGRYLAIGGADRTAQVFEAANGQQVGASMTHQGDVVRVAFSQDGSRLATASLDGTQHLFEIPSGKEVARLGHEYGVNSVALSRDTSRVAVASGSDVRVFEMETHQELARIIQEFDVGALDFSPDGHRLVIGSDGEDNAARIFEVASGKEIAHLPTQGPVEVAAFSPDGRWVITGSKDHYARVFEADTGKEVARSIHEGDVESVAFSPDNHWLALGPDDSASSVFKAQNSNELAYLVQDGEVIVTAFSPDNRLIASGSEDKRACVYDLASGTQTVCRQYQGVVDSLAFSLSSRWLLAGDHNAARMIDVRSGKDLLQFSDQGEVLSVAFGCNDHCLATGGADRNLRIFDISRGAAMPTKSSNAGSAIRAVAFSSDGRRLATGAFDGAGARIFEADSGKQVSLLPHPDTVLTVAFSPDGRWIATGSVDKTARLFRIPEGKEVLRFIQPGLILAVAFSPDGRWLGIGSYGNSARVFDVASGKEIARLESATSAGALRFTNGGRILETASVGSNFVSVQRHFLRSEDLIREICFRINRNLTQGEWKRFFIDEPYRQTCPALP